jgi:small conductance mechanosensitive channel
MFENLMIDQLPAVISQKVLKIAAYLVGAWLAKKAVVILVKRAKFAPGRLGREPSERQKQRVKTISNLIINSSKIVINFVVFVMILSELGVNITPLLTGAGIMGLAVGFGAKSLVADLIAGFFIILENQFNVGDQIEAGGHKGRVVKITIRTTTLKDKEKNRHIIPNSAIKSVTRFPKPKKPA